MIENVLDNSLFTESDDTTGCIYIPLRHRPPEDEQGNAESM
jgi:hypothetical protein